MRLTDHNEIIEILGEKTIDADTLVDGLLELYTETGEKILLDTIEIIRKHARHTYLAPGIYPYEVGDDVILAHSASEARMYRRW